MLRDARRYNHSREREILHLKYLSPARTRALTGVPGTGAPSPTSTTELAGPRTAAGVPLCQVFYRYSQPLLHSPSGLNLKYVCLLKPGKFCCLS